MNHCSYHIIQESFMSIARSAAVAVLISILVPVRSSAQPYAEVDPLAYMMKGYSLHGGMFFGNYKADLGVFGLTVPSSVHGNKDFTVSMSGVGAKWHYTGGTEGGWFAGLGGGYTTTHYEVAGGKTERHRFSLGVEGGYRYQFPGSGFYIQPWLGIDHPFGGKTTVVNGKTFTEGELSFFPTVHVGWKF